MYYNGRFLTILTICIIIYSFYYYNKDADSNAGMQYHNSPISAPRYKMEIDPERTDLAWYERWILRYALNKKEKQERQAWRDIEQLERLENVERIENHAEFAAGSEAINSHASASTDESIGTDSEIDSASSDEEVSEELCDLESKVDNSTCDDRQESLLPSSNSQASKLQAK